MFIACTSVVILALALSFLWVMSVPLRNFKYPQPIPASWHHVAVAQNFLGELPPPVTVCEVGSGVFGRFRKLAESPEVEYTGIELQRILYGLSCVMGILLPYRNRVHFQRSEE